MSLPEAGASVATHAVVHASYRVHVVQNRAVVCDDAIFLPSLARVGRVSRPVLTVVVAGRARVRIGSFDRWLEAGDMVLLPSKDVSMRQEGTPFESVALEWDPGTLGGAPSETEHAKLAPGDLAPLVALARDLAGCAEPAAAMHHTAELIARLRACGAPLDRVGAGALVEPVPESTRRLSGALDAALSDLAGAPMLVDLGGALGLSPRQLNRVVAAFNARYGYNSLGWRDTRNRRRLLVGASMMTAPGARTDGVARRMGYASPTGFCHALAEAGMPSPGTMPAAVARLG
jgi:hypothetical protein